MEAGPQGGVVLVTGGASGIGRATCLLAAQRGASVAVLDRDGEAAEATAAELKGGPHAWASADVADQAELERAVTAIASNIGSPTALVAAAGISGRLPLERLGPADLRAMFDVNVHGSVYACQSVVPAMRRAGGGVIALVSSVAAHTGGGFLGSAHYAASKAALIGLSRALARELAPAGIRVNAIAPGPVDTGLLADVSPTRRRAFAAATLLGRVARPEEIAATIAFAIGPDASYITGETLNVNGGAHFS